ncbi:putative photosystem I [Rosa chinensis]|uniref:Putative photosystem I n=1 Tax=Rosa chinensis TaxID=74649 RepID=A0A2P6SMR7_ROSCH|nr:putative photosystem I [Rosa chinensis]
MNINISSTNGPAFNGGRSIWLPGSGDIVVHHAIALGLHTTTLISVKGALGARGSKLMPKPFFSTSTVDLPRHRLN